MVTILPLAALSRKIERLERENRALRAWIRLKAPMPAHQAVLDDDVLDDDDGPGSPADPDVIDPDELDPVPPDPEPAPDSPNPDDETPEAEPEAPDGDDQQPETDVGMVPGVPPGVPALPVAVASAGDLTAATQLVLQTLANHQGLRLSEIVQQTGVPKYEVSEILKTLRRQNRVTVSGQKRGTRYHGVG